MGKKAGAVSRRGFFTGLIRDALNWTLEGGNDRTKGEEIKDYLSSFDSLPILGTYPRELFEDEARRQGIDFDRDGEEAAIRRIVTNRIKDNLLADAALHEGPDLQSVAHVDPVTTLQNYLDGIFRTTIPNEPARKRIGIRGISEMWGDSPIWYLWFEDKRGAYSLELAEAAVARWSPGGGNTEGFNATLGHFRIKYFPEIEDENLFNDLSFYEQAVRTSDLFDPTGTPSFEGSGQIHESHFLVGNLDIAVAAENNILEVFLQAPDRSRTYHPEGLFVDGKEGGLTKVLFQGERDRNVPSWALSWFLVDKLIIAHCLARKTTPACIALLEKPGVVFDIDKENRIAQRPSLDVRQMFLLGCIPLMNDPHSDKIISHDLDEYGKGLLERDPLQEAKLLRMQTEVPAERTEWIDSEWWYARDREIPTEGMTCSCMDDA
jgi:hypothetical protein